MLKVEVATTMVNEKRGTSAKTGKAYCIREQEAWVTTYDREGKQQPHPQKFNLTLDDDQKPYELGNYIIDPASIYVDRFGQLAIRARLRAPVVGQQQRAA